MNQIAISYAVRVRLFVNDTLDVHLIKLIPSQVAAQFLSLSEREMNSKKAKSNASKPLVHARDCAREIWQERFG